MFVLEGCSDRHPGQHRDVSMRSVILVLEEVIAATIEVPVGDVCMRSYLGRYALFALPMLPIMDPLCRHPEGRLCALCP